MPYARNESMMLKRTTDIYLQRKAFSNIMIIHKRTCWVVTIHNCYCSVLFIRNIPRNPTEYDSIWTEKWKLHSHLNYTFHFKPLKNHLICPTANVCRKLITDHNCLFFSVMGCGITFLVANPVQRTRWYSWIKQHLRMGLCKDSKPDTMGKGLN